jgi:hypothetical protein
MTEYEVMQGVRERRTEVFAACNNDLQQLLQYLREREALSPRKRVVAPPPSKIPQPKPAIDCESIENAFSG